MIVEFNVICRWKGESIDAFTRYVTTCKSKGYETSLRTLNLEMKISDVQRLQLSNANASDLANFSNALNFPISCLFIIVTITVTDLLFLLSVQIK